MRAFLIPDTKRKRGLSFPSEAIGVIKIKDQSKEYPLQELAMISDNIIELKGNPWTITITPLTDQSEEVYYTCIDEIIKTKDVPGITQNDKALIYKDIALQLGFIELYYYPQIEGWLPQDAVINFILERLNGQYHFSFDIDFVSNAFQKIDQNILAKFDVSIITRILKSKSLLVDQCVLLNFLMKYHKDNKIRDLDLFEYIDFSLVPSEKFNEFLDYVLRSESIITTDKVKGFLKSNIYQGDIIQHFPSGTSEGVISCMNNTFKNNPLECGELILIPSTNRTKANEDVSFLIYKTNDTYWCSFPSPGQYIVVGFPKRRLKLEGMMLVPINNYFPKSFRIYGSDDKDNFNILLYEQTEAIEYANTNFRPIYITVKSPKFFKYFKIESTGISFRGDYYFLLNSIELYGDIYPMISSK